MTGYSTIDQETTRKVARLARLELSPAEIDLYTQQLNQVLEYFQDLATLNTEGVEPLIHPLEQTLILRDDRVEAPFCDSEGQPKVLNSAPETVSDGFKVPPVL